MSSRPPDRRGADGESAAALGLASDGLGPAFPRGGSRGASGPSLLKTAGPSLGFTGVTPEAHRPSPGAAAGQVPAPLPHVGRRFSTAGNPAHGQPAATEHPPLRPDGPASPAREQPGGSPAYGLPRGFRRQCCARRPVRERRRRARQRCRAARVRWAAVAAAPIVPDGRPARTGPEAARRPRCERGWRHGGATTCQHVPTDRGA